MIVSRGLMIGSSSVRLIASSMGTTEPGRFHVLRTTWLSSGAPIATRMPKVMSTRGEPRRNGIIIRNSTA